MLPCLIVSSGADPNPDGAKRPPTGPRGETAPVNWLLRNRQTGEITVAQAPNPPLWIFLGTVLVRLVFRPSGAAGTTLEIVSRGALAWWAVDEILRGVNPFRRILGAGVLAGIVASLTF